VAGLTGVIRSAWRGTMAWYLMLKIHPAGDFPWLLCYRAHRQDIGFLLNVIPKDGPTLELKS